MTRLWSEQHQPASEAELVVTKKKVLEVRDFLTLGANAGRRVLVLRGPAGCGKAAVLRALCNDLRFEIVEWSVAVRGGARGEASGVFREPLGDAFLRFLAQTDRYRCLQTEAPTSGCALPRRPRVTLVRDFPFTLLDGPGGGRQADAGDFLQRFQALFRGGALQRAVFCFNDSREDYFVVSKLLGPLDPGLVLTVSFDGVPRTFAQRALEAAARAQGLDPAAANVAAIAAECGGDLRHALNALQLASAALRGAAPKGRAAGCGRGRRGAGGAGGPRPPTPQGGASGAPGAAPGAGEARGGAGEAGGGGESGLRSSSLGLFHALGRLLYCKRLPPEGPAAPGAAAASQPGARNPKRKRPAGEAEPRQLPPELLVPKATRPPLYFVPEDVLRASNAEPATVVDWLFTNAPRFYGDVEDLANFAETLADVDTWHGIEWQPGGSQAVGSSAEALAGSVQVRSLLDANLHPVPPTFADPCGGPQRPDSSAPGAAIAFNMARPLMRDVLRHRQRRIEELNVHLEGVGPQALGSGSAGADMCIRTLPFVHLMLGHSRGMHPRLRFLPHPLMQAIKDLSGPIDSPCFVGADGPASDRGRELLQGPAAGAAALPAAWGTALADDPIEGPDG